jgi:uncharacterized hydantoinase/oxoprolinase family protein
MKAAWRLTSRARPGEGGFRPYEIWRDKGLLRKLQRVLDQLSPELPQVMALTMTAELGYLRHQARGVLFVMDHAIFPAQFLGEPVWRICLTGKRGSGLWISPPNWLATAICGPGNILCLLVDVGSTI